MCLLRSVWTHVPKDPLNQGWLFWQCEISERDSSLSETWFDTTTNRPEDQAKVKDKKVVFLWRILSILLSHHINHNNKTIEKTIWTSTCLRGGKRVPRCQGPGAGPSGLWSRCHRAFYCRPATCRPDGRPGGETQQRGYITDGSGVVLTSESAQKVAAESIYDDSVTRHGRGAQSNTGGRKLLWKARKANLWSIVCKPHIQQLWVQEEEWY